MPLPVLVGDQRYQGSVLMEGHTWARIVVHKTGTILFRDGSHSLCCLMVGAAEPVQVTGLPGVWDIVKDSNGDVWIATTKGIYRYCHVNNSGIYCMAEDKCIYRLAVCNDDCLYATDSCYNLYFVHNNALARVPDVPRAHCISFNREGDLYYTEGASGPVRRKTSGLGRDSVTILGGLPDGNVNQIEVDKKSNCVYIHHEEGLYFKPADNRLMLVKEIKRVMSIGFDDEIMYLGVEGKVMKMVPDYTMEKVHLEAVELERDQNTNIAELEKMLSELTVRMSNVNSSLLRMEEDNIKNIGEMQEQYQELITKNSNVMKMNELVISELQKQMREVFAILEKTMTSQVSYSSNADDLQNKINVSNSNLKNVSECMQINVSKIYAGPSNGHISLLSVPTCKDGETIENTENLKLLELEKHVKRICADHEHDKQRSDVRFNVMGQELVEIDIKNKLEITCLIERHTELKKNIELKLKKIVEQDVKISELESRVKELSADMIKYIATNKDPASVEKLNN